MLISASKFSIVDVDFRNSFFFRALQMSISAFSIADVDFRNKFFNSFVHCECRHPLQNFQLRMSTFVIDFLFIFSCIVDVDIRFSNFNCGCQHLF